MTTVIIVVSSLLIALGCVVFATIITAGVLRFLNRPVEPPECCGEGEE